MDWNRFLAEFTYVLTLYALFPVVLAAGLYLSFKTRFFQITRLKKSFYCLLQSEKEAQGNISRFRAISSVLAGNLGTGNISGMAVALTTGGPGALVWMWIMVLFGSIIQYVSCVLGVSYRKKTEGGEYVGGPMYYLSEGLGFKKLAILFSCLTLFGALTIGNLAQINSVVLPLQSVGLNPFYCSLALSVLVGAAIFGGIKRISAFASVIVPLKALLYLLSACAILFFHYDRVIPAFKLMFAEAFDFSALTGGVLGSQVLKAIFSGFGRGLFATDAGLGIVPILQASAKSKNPVMDGISTFVAPFIVMIVCTATGLVLITTGAYEIAGLESTNMVTYAFSKGLRSDVGGYIVMTALLLFAFTTIMAWCYCGEKALEYLFGKNSSFLFRIFYIAVLPLGSLLHVDLIWSLADLAVLLMLSINLIGVIGLSRQVIASTKQAREESLLQMA